VRRYGFALVNVFGVHKWADLEGVLGKRSAVADLVKKVGE